VKGNEERERKKKKKFSCYLYLQTQATHRHIKQGCDFWLFFYGDPTFDFVLFPRGKEAPTKSFFVQELASIFFFYLPIVFFL